MRRFEEYEGEEARAYALLGGQAMLITGWVTTPDKRAPLGHARRDTMAQLFDCDVDRLTKTARDLSGGVHSVMQWRPGWDIFTITIGETAIKHAEAGCFSRILRRTIEPTRIIRRTVKQCTN